MTESLDVIYKGYATTIKNKEYLSPKAYIEPFVDRLKPYTNKFICQVKTADQMSVDGDIQMVYNKVLVMGIFPEEYDIKVQRFGHEMPYHRIVCMTYSIDTRKPYCKFYTGVIDEDMNFYAFGADCISLQEIEPDTPLDYTPVDFIIKNGLSDQCSTMINQFDSISLDKDSMVGILGNWIDFVIKKEYVNDSGKMKLASNLAINSYKSLMLDRDSDYYSEDPDISMHDLYRSWANQLVKDEKDINNRYEKTQLINQLLKL